jgi:thimet oligopeptidase
VKKIMPLILLVIMTTQCINKTKGNSAMYNKESFQKLMHKKVETQDQIAQLFPKTPQDIKNAAALSKDLLKNSVDAYLKIPEEERTFDTTVTMLDNIEQSFSRIESILGLLMEVSTDEDVRKECLQTAMDLNKFSIDIFANKKFYKIFLKYEKTIMQQETLSEEDYYYFNESLKSFQRQGFDLEEEKFEKLKKLNKEISDLGLLFDQNISKDKSTVKISKDNLTGLAEDFIKNLKQEDDLYVLGCDYPTYTDVMQNCSVEDTRKKLYFTFQNRAYPNNLKLLHEVIKKRDQKAKILGFESYAALNLDALMAKTTKTVKNFLYNLKDVSFKKAEKEIEKLKKNLPEEVTLGENNTIKSWDMSFVVNAYKKKFFHIDENKIAEYFPVEKAIQGMFYIYQEFLGVHFDITKPDWSWHEDVQLIKITDKITKQLLGHLFIDLYPRENKYSHACHGTIIHRQHRKDLKTGEYEDVTSLGFVLANFPKATSTKPALLKHGDVVTFFHEFGHAMHAVLGKTKFAGTSGTSVKRDFVEVPSQMFEEWMFNEEMLKKVSSHYKTGESLPHEIIEKKVALKKFNSGNFVLRQVYLSLLSLEYFNSGDSIDTDTMTQKIYNETIKHLGKFEPKTHFQAAFGHLIGYGTGYYGYMWSKVFALDLFYTIKKIGLLSPQAGKKFVETILSKGGSSDPNEFLEQYLGRKPNQQAFFEDLGFDR